MLDPPDEQRHPVLAKLAIVWPLAVLFALLPQTAPWWWPALVYAWAAVTSGGLLGLWWVERHFPTAPGLPPLRVRLLVWLYLLPVMDGRVPASDRHRALGIHWSIDRRIGRRGRG